MNLPIPGNAPAPMGGADTQNQGVAAQIEQLQHEINIRRRSGAGPAELKMFENQLAQLQGIARFPHLPR